MTKIALLSDIHGNMTALEAVLADSQRAKVDEYWLLGDTLMPVQVDVRSWTCWRNYRFRLKSSVTGKIVCGGP